MQLTYFGSFQDETPDRIKTDESTLPCEGAAMPRSEQTNAVAKQRGERNGRGRTQIESPPQTDCRTSREQAMMNLKVLAMAITYSSGCGTLPPDTQTKIDNAVEAVSPNARWHLGQMTHRGTALQRRSEFDLENYRSSMRGTKNSAVLKAKIEARTK